MSELITQRELRNDSGRIMRALDSGASFVVSRGGVPVGELRPMRRARFVPSVDVAATFAGAPEIDYEQLRCDLDEAVDQDVPDRV